MHDGIGIASRVINKLNGKSMEKCVQTPAVLVRNGNLTFTLYDSG